LDKLPGARDLSHGGDGGPAAAGLACWRGMMGGSLAAASVGGGLSMDQIKSLGTVTLDYAKEKAGRSW
jgi:hypothetical protein